MKNYSVLQGTSRKQTGGFSDNYDLFTLKEFSNKEEAFNFFNQVKEDNSGVDSNHVLLTQIEVNDNDDVEILDFFAY